MKSFLCRAGRCGVLCSALLLVLILSACTHKVDNNGVYFFDGDAFRTTLKNSDDEMLKSIPEDVMAQTLDGLKDFKIEITQDTQAVATFGDVVVKGTLAKIGVAGTESKFTMTPVDEDKKNDVVTLIVKDGSLILDPGKKETDRMFFKKKS